MVGTWLRKLIRPVALPLQKTKVFIAPTRRFRPAQFSHQYFSVISIQGHQNRCYVIIDQFFPIFQILQNPCCTLFKKSSFIQD